MKSNMIKKTILFLSLITITFNQFCAQNIKTQAEEAQIKTPYKHSIFLFLDTQTNSCSKGIFVFDPEQTNDAEHAAEIAHDAAEINSMFGTSDMLFVATIATDTPIIHLNTARGETHNFERYGDYKIGAKPRQIPRYFPLSVFCKGASFKKDGDLITLTKDVALDNGQIQKIEFVFVLCQHHGLSRKKVNIDDLLRTYLTELLEGRCTEMKKSKSPIFDSVIPGLAIATAEYEFGPLPSAEMAKILKT